jgi:hypothetical protein
MKGASRSVAPVGFGSVPHFGVCHREDIHSPWSAPENTRSAINKAIAVPVCCAAWTIAGKTIYNNELSAFFECGVERQYVKRLSVQTHTYCEARA